MVLAHGSFSYGAPQMCVIRSQYLKRFWSYILDSIFDGQEDRWADECNGKNNMFLILRGGRGNIVMLLYNAKLTRWNFSAAGIALRKTHVLLQPLEWSLRSYRRSCDKKILSLLGTKTDSSSESH